jgi:hypothetical protein
VKLEVGDLVTITQPSGTRLLGTIFETDHDCGYWVNIHFRDDEYNENNLKLLSKK